MPIPSSLAGRPLSQGGNPLLSGAAPSLWFHRRYQYRGLRPPAGFRGSARYEGLCPCCRPVSRRASRFRRCSLDPAPIRHVPGLHGAAKRGPRAGEDPRKGRRQGGRGGAGVPGREGEQGQGGLLRRGPVHEAVRGPFGGALPRGPGSVHRPYRRKPCRTGKKSWWRSGRGSRRRG